MGSSLIIFNLLQITWKVFLINTIYCSLFKRNLFLGMYNSRVPRAFMGDRVNPSRCPDKSCSSNKYTKGIPFPQA